MCVEQAEWKETCVPRAVVCVGTADLQEVLGGPHCLDNRNYIAILRDLLYGCLSTAAVMASLLTGVFG